MVIGQPVFEMASDLAEALSWLGSLIEQINNVKASVTEQISSMNDEADSVLTLLPIRGRGGGGFLAHAIRLAARTLEPFHLESPKFLTFLLCPLDTL